MTKFPTITALLQELTILFGATPAETTTEPPAEQQPPAATTRRGRAPKTETQQPAEPDPKAATGKSEAELRELIRPLIEEQGRGAEVKAILTKLGAAKLSELAPEKHAEFVRSVEALLI